MKVKMKVEMKTMTTMNGTTDVEVFVCVDFELSLTVIFCYKHPKLEYDLVY